jgi:amino acid transporter
MFLNAARIEPTRWAERGIGVGVLTFALLVHAMMPNWGLRLQNALGIFKIAVLLFIVVAGFVALGGHVRGGAPNPSNFTNAFEGARDVNATSFVNGLYSVIWSFIGYSNVFYVVSEVRNPIRTIKIAAPLALGLVTILCV